MALVAEIRPNGSADVINRATALYNVGQIDEAARVVENYLQSEPDDAQGLTLLATILKKGKHLAAAYQLAKRAAEIRPDRPEVWVALGHCAQQLWRLDESRSAYRKAYQRAQNDAQRALYLNNIGSTHLDAGEFAKARPVLEQALELAPTDTMAQHNLGLSLLAQRDWRNGWQNYAASIGSEARRVQKYMPAPGEPVWDGTKGQRVVVYGEQGLGDEICAASMVPDVARDATVILDCDRRLEGLFRRSFPQVTVYGTRWDKQLAWAPEHRQVDASIAGFELGKFYRNADADFPGTPYLVADHDRVLMWKALWASKRKPTIGVAWTGGTWHNAGAFRQLPLREWQPIFDAVDATWVSLQYKDASAEIAGTPVVQYAHATLTKDYDDTAALVASCDLVIGMQTSVCHLAGALGVPVWTLIPTTSQWRYGEGYTAVPWYRSMTLYRQGKDWPVREIAERLHAHF